MLNIPVIFLFHALVYPSYLLAFAYYMCIGLFGLAAYMWFRNAKRFKEKGYAQHMDLKKWETQRAELLSEIQAQIPVA
jgi:hypothetical protein